MNTNIRRLADSGILIALAFILSMIPIWQMPFGGKVTLVSMLPMIFLGYKYGVKWGLLCGFIYALLQLMLDGLAGFGFLEGLTTWAIVGTVTLDFLLAFTVLGVAGILKGRMQNKAKAFLLGTLLACGLRFLAHFISGFVIFGIWAEWGLSQMGAIGEFVLTYTGGFGMALIYSLLYNLAYMMPETILTVAVGIGLFALPAVRERL